jgi:hypothetical protein
MFMRLLKDHEGKKAGSFIDVDFLPHLQLLKAGVAELYDGDKPVKPPPPKPEQPAAIEPQAIESEKPKSAPVKAQK